MLTGETNLFSEPASEASAESSEMRITKTKEERSDSHNRGPLGLLRKGAEDHESGKYNTSEKLTTTRIPFLIISGDHEICFPPQNSFTLTPGDAPHYHSPGRNGPGKGLNDAFRSIAKTTSTASTSRGSRAAVAAVRTDFKLPRASVAAVEFQSPAGLPTYWSTSLQGSGGCGLHHKRREIWIRSPK